MRKKFRRYVLLGLASAPLAAVAFAAQSALRVSQFGNDTTASDMQLADGGHMSMGTSSPKKSADLTT